MGDILYCDPPLEVAQDALGSFLSCTLNRKNAEQGVLKCTILNRIVLLSKVKAQDSPVLFLSD